MDSPFSSPKDSGFRSLAEFYPFYLSEHRHPVSRVLHYVGTWGSVLSLLALIATGESWWLLAGLACGYTFAWVGHFLSSTTVQPRSGILSTASPATFACGGN